MENDGEREYLIHKSPAGSRLSLNLYKDVRVNSSAKLPASITDPIERAAYLAADLEECYAPAQNIATWAIRGIRHALGRAPRMQSEKLGKLKGFTYFIRRRNEHWW